jgi:hypothetical protein
VAHTLTRTFQHLTTLHPIGAALPHVRTMGRFWPLWRHAVWASALFAVCTLAVGVRLEVQRIRKDLDRIGAEQRSAHVKNDRLHLEIDARRRATATRRAASDAGLVPDAKVVVVRADEAGS